MGAEPQEGAWALLRSAWEPTQHLRALWPATARRQAGGGERLTPLDGARALALLWVLGFHTVFLSCLRGVDVAGPGGASQPGLTSAQPANKWLTNWSTQPSANGDAGVDVFFVLSGFLIARMWLQEVQKTGHFWVFRFLARRFLRIWPMLALALGLQAALDAYQGNSSDCATRWWTVLLFVNNYLPSGCLAQSWSVAVEAQFYLLSPLIMLGAFSPARRAPRRWGLAGLCAGSLVGVAINGAIMAADGTAGFMTYGWWPPVISYTLVFARSPPYLAGMAAALVVHQARQGAAALPTHSAPAGKGSPLERGDSAKVPLGTRGSRSTCSTANGEAQDAVEGSVDVSFSEERAAGDPAAAALEQERSGTAAAAGPAPAAAVPAAAAGGSGRGSSAGRRRLAIRRGGWRGARLCTLAIDCAALAVALGLAYCGVGDNRWTQLKAPGWNQALQVAGRWALGVAVARLFTAMLLGRQRALAWLLSLDLWLPAAVLSYSAYLLQNWAFIVPPSWASAGVTTMWAAWGTNLLAFAAVALISLAFALPCHLLVEAPCARLWPRGWTPARRF